MKKIIKVSILSFIFITFLFNFSLNAQIIRDLKMAHPNMDRIVSELYGMVWFLNKSNLGESNSLEAEITVKLKKNKYYSLQMVKLNDMKLVYTPAHFGKWHLNKNNFNCRVGQTLVLSAILVRKDLRERLREIPKTFILATYRIPSLIKRMEFPRPGMIVYLRLYRMFLPFKWSFLGIKQYSRLRIRQVPGSEIVWKLQNENYSKVPKSVFQSGKVYKISLGTISGRTSPGGGFKATRYVFPRSELSFSNIYYSMFRTR